jgi:hypothetical protein
MRFVGTALSLVVAVLAAGVIAFTFADETAAPESTTLAFTRVPPTASPTPAKTPIPRTWLDGIGPMPFGRGPVLLTCLDRDRNGALDGSDDLLFFGIELELSPEDACVNPIAHADYYDAVSPPGFGCASAQRPVYLVVIGGGGSDLLDASQGDSIGLISVTRALRAQADAANVNIALTLSSGAVIGAEMAQTSLEELLALHLTGRLTALPCALAVLIGHSHGGVTVTTLTSALENRFGERMLGVIVDRSNVLYDRPAENMPVTTPIINVFQMNEGWHGVPIEQANVTNVDASSEIAPIAPADGGGGPARVTHRSLDDSGAVQARIVAEIIGWLAAAPQR